jgi:septum formation protein
MNPLILASTSSYRKELLERLKIPFVQISPIFEEIAAEGEHSLEMVARFAIGKARSVQKNLDEPGLVIGSDQVALLGDQILNKPLTHAKAIQQLSQCSGRTVCFHTALCLLNGTNQEVQSSVDEYRVHFRRLSTGQIDSYLRSETPYDCAGSFRAEGLGIALITGMSGNDYTSLIGLPLLSLLEMLRKEGIEPLA